MRGMQCRPPGQKLLNPFEFAKAMNSLATKQADEAAAALNLARNTVEAKGKGSKGRKLRGAQGRDRPGKSKGGG